MLPWCEYSTQGCHCISPHDISCLSARSRQYWEWCHELLKLVSIWVIRKHSYCLLYVKNMLISIFLLYLHSKRRDHYAYRKRKRNKNITEGLSLRILWVCDSLWTATHREDFPYQRGFQLSVCLSAYSTNQTSDGVTTQYAYTTYLSSDAAKIQKVIQRCNISG